jgi:ATP-dependent HslUV protease subunit HslV
MTTIAYRNGIIAADTGLTAGCLRDGHVEKIAKRKDGSVAGASGEAWWIVAFLEWFKNGGEVPHIVDGGVFSVALVVNKRRKVTIYESEKGRTWSYEIKGPYHAIGSGRQVALGALHTGAHVVDAVKAAMVHDDGTYGKVQSLKVGW